MTAPRLTDDQRKLVESSRLPRVLARLHRNRWLSEDELEQIGRLAQWRAAPRYDPSRGYFDRFTYQHVDFSMKKAIAREQRRSLRSGRLMALYDGLEAVRDEVNVFEDSDEEQAARLDRVVRGLADAWFVGSAIDHPEDALVRSEDGARLNGLIEALGEPDQTILRLRIQGEDYETIAQEVRISDSSVGRRLPRLVSMLRARLEAGS